MNRCILILTLIFLSLTTTLFAQLATPPGYKAGALESYWWADLGYNSTNGGSFYNQSGLAVYTDPLGAANMAYNNATNFAATNVYSLPQIPLLPSSQVSNLTQAVNQIMSTGTVANAYVATTNSADNLPIPTTTAIARGATNAANTIYSNNPSGYQTAANVVASSAPITVTNLTTGQISVISLATTNVVISTNSSGVSGVASQSGNTTTITLTNTSSGGGVTTNIGTGNDVYIAPPPFGKNSNTGTNEFSPLGDLVYASNIATNPGQTIWVESGLNYVPCQTQIVLKASVNLKGMSLASTLIFTNSNLNATYAKIYCVLSNVVDGLTIYDLQTNTSGFIFGSGTAENRGALTNIVVQNCTMWCNGMGYHVEGNTYVGEYIQFYFLNDIIHGNRTCINNECGGLMDLLVKNCILDEINFTNIPNTTGKPRCCVEYSKAGGAQATGKIIFDSDVLRYSDIDMSGSNTPCYALYDMPSSAIPGNAPTGQNTNLYYFNSCTFCPQAVTNILSKDVYGGTNVFNLSQSCIRSDGLLLTYTNDYSITPSPINWIIASRNASALTNINSTYAAAPTIPIVSLSSNSMATLLATFPTLTFVTNNPSINATNTVTP
jgi:hypothetical protein